MAHKGAESSRQFLQMADIAVTKGYRLGPCIGEGSYAKVRIIERATDGEILAAKIISLKKAPENYMNRFLTREMSILGQISHANIVNVCHIILESDYVFIVMEYAEKGDLLDLIRKQGPMVDSVVKRMYSEILAAIDYLHHKNLVHRDLKCENILITRNMTVKITDFGFGRSLHVTESDKPVLCQTFCGSAAYSSPELLQGIPYSPIANDVWSLGCVLYIMVCAAMPFDDRNITKMVKQQQKEVLHFPRRMTDKIHPVCKELICQILEPSIEKRFTLDNILKSQWLLGIERHDGGTTCAKIIANTKPADGRSETKITNKSSE